MENMTKEDIKQAKQYIEKLRREYIEKHTKPQERDELIFENNVEKRDVKGYHGREILELLQNADDAYQKSIDLGEKPETDLEVVIAYFDDKLSVTNTGTAFDANGIKAIVQGNNTSKRGNYIGNKGTGFRSILNWAKSVKILSGVYHIEFSEVIAKEEFEKIKETPQIKKQLERQPDLYLPMLAVPRFIDTVGQSNTTTIELVLDSEKQDDDYSVIKQLENIDLMILMFLPNIRSIKIILKNNTIIYRKSDRTTEFHPVTLQKIIDGEVKIEKSFYLFNKEIKNALQEEGEQKDIRLAVAVPKNFGDFDNGHLYSFFPLLNTTSPFRCVMHASYSLGDHRNTVISSKTNKQIVKEQLVFLLEIADRFVAEGMSDVALELILPVNFTNHNWKFPSTFAEFCIEEEYLNNLQNFRFFQTVNGDYISINDGPKIFEKQFPALFKGKNFRKLLKCISNDKVVELIKYLISRSNKTANYGEDELRQKINEMSDNWSVQERVEVFVWWNESNRFSLPQLLKTQDNKWLNYQEECYFLVGDFDDLELPLWVKIPALGQAYQEELFKLSENSEKILNLKHNDVSIHISRIISQNAIYPTIKFNYRDRNSIISAVNSSVVSYDQAVEFVLWLWKNYSQDLNWTPPINLSYNFPTQEKKIKNSDELFVGESYGNALAEKLFDESFSGFPSLSIFQIGNDKIEQFVSFICKFGVKKYPSIETQIISNPLLSYVSDISSEINNNPFGGSYTNADEFEYTLPYVKDLDKIITDLYSTDVISWILGDVALQNCLGDRYYSSDSHAEITYKLKNRHLRSKYQGRIRNYILEIFNESKWIEIGKSKYAPREVLIDAYTKTNQRYAQLVPVLDDSLIKGFASALNISFDDVVNVFKLFDFCEKITDLSSQEFYGLLLQLPNLENFRKSEDISRSIYRLVEKPDFSKSFKDSPNKKLFLERGKVLVQYQGTLRYELVSNAYLPSTKIVNKKKIPIVEKGQRTNNENFVRIFGCREYSREYYILQDSIVESSVNFEFQQLFLEFRKYACAYAERNDNIKRFGGALSITLVESIRVKEDENVDYIKDEYACIRKSTTEWYITIFGSKILLNELSEAIENIYSNIANTSGFDASKLGELFRAGNKSDREFLIKKEFGHLGILQDERYQNTLKLNFMEVLEKFNKKLTREVVTLIDFDNFQDKKNVQHIIALFKQLNIDVKEFKDAGFVYSLDLTNYHKTFLREFIEKESRAFKNVLFARALSNEELQKTFLTTYDTFVNFELIQCENSVNYNIENVVVSKFFEWRNKECSISADEEYKKNYESLNKDNLYCDDIANNRDVQRMIYFDKKEEFEFWLRDKKSKEQEESSHVVNDEYASYRKKIPNRLEVSYSGVDAKLVAEKKNTHSVYTSVEDERRRRNQKKLGNKGELLIYNLLCDIYGKDQVFPRSEAFVMLGILKSGQAVSGDYDLSYKDDTGKEYFVEVKTGSKNSFFMSLREIEFAREHSDKYKLILVYDVDDNEPKYTELPMRFWEDNRFHKHEIIERIKVEF